MQGSVVSPSAPHPSGWGKGATGASLEVPGDLAATLDGAPPRSAETKLAILGSRGYPSYYGGFETLVRHLAPYLAQRGHEVTVYGRGHPRLSAPMGTGISVRTTWGIDKKSTSTLSYGLMGSIDLARRGCGSALVLNVANGFHLKRLSQAGIRTCVNVDGVEWMRAKWGRMARTIFLRGAELTTRHADALIFDSRAIQDMWVSKFGRDGIFIPYGAPVLEPTGTAKLRAAGLPEGGYVLVVARVVPENNIELMLDAVERIVPRPRVVVVGDGNYKCDAVCRLTQLNEAGVINWLGHISDQELLDQLWSHAGVCWHGHSVGGTNPALLQALGAGAPTIALDTPFNREVLGDGYQLVPMDVPQVSDRLRGVLNDDMLRHSLITAGQQLVRERYCWDEVCKSYAEILQVR
jgi:glycosyltransferase involved in cell wall biosynthesis